MRREHKWETRTWNWRGRRGCSLFGMALVRPGRLVFLSACPGQGRRIRPPHWHPFDTRTRTTPRDGTASPSPTPFYQVFSQRHCGRNRTIRRHKSRGGVEVGRVALCIATTGNLTGGDVLSTEERRIGGSFEGCCLFHWKARHLHLQGCVWGFVQ